MEQDNSTINATRAALADAGEKALGERPTMEHALLLLFLVVGLYMYLGASEYASAAQTFPRLMAGGTVVLSFLLLTRNYLTVAAPVIGAALGAYFVYGGATSFIDDGEGLLRLAVGVGLLIGAVGYRERFGAAVESFVAEPMQVMGDKETSGAPVADETELEDVDEADADAATEGTETDADTAETETEAEAESDSSAMYVYDIDDPRGPIVTGLLCTGYMVLTFLIGMLYATPIFVVAWVLWVRMELIKAVGLTVLSFATAYLFYDLIQDDIAEGWLTGWELPPPDDLLGLSIYAGDLLQWAVMIV
ncbi:hypothetical protein CV102_05095 [Natronococcus pandeyae]|uniref:Tripartite tricarboxylate transporter TctB family protein n=1 Tax=Natronococcus pandeyae TaxID=2055836 RepID=A0A8J8TR82_9EURY|nr:hypothetical protein [Natronococcus pandeyae]TYL39666.1 hypothetical protein CV102_05095 [Natronococcus pandeyae]